MSKKIKVFGCPCCGSKAHWTKGDKSTGMNDRVQCLECFLEIEGDHKPQSALIVWNFRVLDHLIEDSVYNIDGERIE